MRGVGVAAAVLLLFAGGVHGQGSCTITQREGAQEAIFSNMGQPNQVALVFLAVITCADGRRFLADTATSSSASGIIELFGRVEATDRERILRAGRATFFTRQGQLHAQNNVVVTQRATGSVIRADILNYYQETPQRPQALIVATRTTGPAARAVLYSEAPEGGAAGDSTVVDAHEIQIVGEATFRGTGEAVLTRDSLRATAHQIEYNQDSGSLQVLGGGVVTLPAYQLRGDSITASVDENDEIEEVLTRHGSRLDSDDMQVTAPAIRLFFTDRSVSRMVAMNWQPRPGASAGARPLAVSEQFRMEADSLDVLAPEQRLTEAAAIGGAHVERITPDSLLQYLPDAEPNVRSLIQNDWMRGDTVRAFFTAARADGDSRAAGDTAAAAGAVAAGDTAGVAAGTVPANTPGGRNERVLERLVAVGGPAQAMHRMHPEDASDRLSIAYLVGSRVEVSLEAGVVVEVMAAEDVRGIYLQPTEAARRAAAARPGGTP